MDNVENAYNELEEKKGIFLKLKQIVSEVTKGDITEISLNDLFDIFSISVDFFLDKIEEVFQCSIPFSENDTYEQIVDKISDAVKGEKCNKNIKQPTPENLRKLAERMIDFFQKRDLWSDAGIYTANVCLMSDNYNGDGYYEEGKTEMGTHFFEQKNATGKEITEFADPDTITIFFEGPLYDFINYGDPNFIENLQTVFFQDYGLHLELAETTIIVTYREDTL